MRKTYPGYDIGSICCIIYRIHTSPENQEKMVRLMGDKFYKCFYQNKPNDGEDELELSDFIERLDKKLIVEERPKTGGVYRKMVDENGNPHYWLEGVIASCAKSYDGRMVLLVYAEDMVDPEALCIAIRTVYPDAQVYYITDDYDGGMYRTNDKTGCIFFPPDYSYGYKKEGVFRHGMSDDIDDACELLSKIGFNGEHTEQSLLDFVAGFPIEEEGDSVWFNKLEIDENN